MNERIGPDRREWFAQVATWSFVSGAIGPVRAADPPKVPTVLDWISEQVAGAPLTMRFRGNTVEEARNWQTAFSARLRTLLGGFAPPAKWKSTLIRAVDLPDHRREEWVLSFEKTAALPVYLLLPRPKQRKPRAGILALHGHGNYGHHPVVGREDLPGVTAAIKGAKYDYGRQLVKKGYAVAAPCFIPFGDRRGKAGAFGKQDPCADTFLRMQMLGKLLIAENLRDALWALNFLAEHAEVDAGRLGCVGLSYGGRMTMLTAAMEPRIKVAAISGALNLMQERVGNPYSCGAQIIPGLLQYGDVPEIASLIAPRYCLWEVGKEDRLIKPAQAKEALTRMRKVFKALKVENRLQVDQFDGGHVWNGTVAYKLLEKVLT